MALSYLIELNIFLVQETIQLFNLVVSFLDGFLILRSIGLWNSSIFELFLQRMNFLLFDFNLPHQLLEFIAIHSASIFFLLQLFIFPLEIFQHLL